MYCINDEQRQKASALILAFGIVSLVCALAQMPVIGFVFGLIALIRARGYRKTYGGLDVPVRVGKGLSIAGLILTALPVALVALVLLLVVLYLLIFVIWIVCGLALGFFAL